MNEKLSLSSTDEDDAGYDSRKKRQEAKETDSKEFDKVVQTGGKATWAIFFSTLIFGVGFSVWGLVKYLRDDSRLLHFFIVALCGWTILLGIVGFMLTEITGSVHMHHVEFGWFVFYLAGSIGLFVYWKKEGDFDGTGHKTAWTILCVMIILGVFPILVAFAFYLMYWHKLENRHKKGLDIGATEVLSRDKKKELKEAERLRKKTSKASRRSSTRSGSSKRALLTKKKRKGSDDGTDTDSGDVVTSQYDPPLAKPQRQASQTSSLPSYRTHPGKDSMGGDTDSEADSDSDIGGYKQASRTASTRSNYHDRVREPCSPPSPSTLSRQNSASNYRYSSDTPTSYGPTLLPQRTPSNASSNTVPVLVRLGTPTHTPIAIAHYDSRQHKYTSIQATGHPSPWRNAKTSTSTSSGHTPPGGYQPYRPPSPPVSSYPNPCNTPPSAPPTGYPYSASQYSYDQYPYARPGSTSLPPVSSVSRPYSPPISARSFSPPASPLSRSPTRSARAPPGAQTRPTYAGLSYAPSSYDSLSYNAPRQMQRPPSVASHLADRSTSPLRVTNPDEPPAQDKRNTDSLPPMPLYTPP
ncbi:hypothetical protein JCM11641_005458 [Rhodosporidiobolus odoratus]